MPSCSDKRFEQILYAHELGTLNDEDQGAFEQHLYECESCFTKAQKFQKAARHIKHNPRVRAEIDRIAREEPSAVPLTSRLGTFLFGERRPWARAAALSVALAAVLLLVLTDWDLQFRPFKEAVAFEDRLAIMYFDNLADPGDSLRLGEIVTSLLITDLSESQYLEVVSSQRLYDILKLLGKEGQKKIDQSVATEIATKAGARWMLQGRILQVAPEIVITSELTDVERGNVLASQIIRGTTDERVFDLVDRLAAELRQDLPLPVAFRQEPDRPVVDLTTESPEAYRHYLEGLESLFGLYTDDAEKSFKMALQFDSTFAMAYFWLALWTAGTERPVMIDMALRYADQVTEKERLYLRYMEERTKFHFAEGIQALKELVNRYPLEKMAYLLMAGDYRSRMKQFADAIENYGEAIAIDSLYKPAFNGLAYAYAHAGKEDSAIWAIDRYLALAPEESNPHDTRGDIYVLTHQLDLAAESYRRALGLDPDFAHSISRLGDIALFKRDFEAADSLYRVLASNPSKRWRPWGRESLAKAEMHRGRFQEAMRRLDMGIIADSIELGDLRPWPRISKLFVQMNINYFIFEDFDATLQNLALVRQMAERIDPSAGALSLALIDANGIAAATYARIGDLDSAQVMLERMQRDLDTATNRDLADYHTWRARGWVYLESGRSDSAAACFERMPRKYDLWDWRWRDKQEMLCVAYLRSGRYTDAITAMEPAVGPGLHEVPDQLFSNLRHYFLARAYEGAGQLEKAIAGYRRFIDYWKDADTEIKELEDARQRLANLQT